VTGAANVARTLAIGLHQFGAGVTFEPVEVNGRPGLILRRDGALDSVMTMSVESGLITGFYFVRNPEKLSRANQETELTR
jgi:RNA polymerase sigma-70 factor (ECF subfamily)